MPATTGIILSCHNLDVSYGQVQVLFGVDLDIHDGEMVALLGINGAGKSTLLKALCGLLKPSSGSITLRDENITGLSAERIAPKRISLVPGGKGIFPTLTVAENLRIAAWMSRRDRKVSGEARDYVLELFPVLSERYHQAAGNLSGGEQQMLTLGQSFITRPEVLVIDELSLGLSPVIVGQLMQVVRAANADGTTVILVEQSLNLALDLCQRSVFMEKGEVRFDGRSADLRERPDLLRSVFLEGGGDAEHSVSALEHPAPHDVEPPEPIWVRPAPINSAQDERGWRPGDPVRVPTIALEVRGITLRFGGIRALDEVSLKLHQGEILALIGGNGAGKTTLFDVISGFALPDAGKVLLAGSNVTRWSPARRAKAGLGRSFQDALLFSSLTVRDAIAVAFDRHTDVRDPLSLALGFPIARDSEKNVRARVGQLMELIGIRPFADKFLSELSTGTRRMVDLACSLAFRPDVLLLDEPAAGIAQKETEALGPLLKKIRDETGASLLIVEHDMPLIRIVAERAMVLEAGSVIATGTPEEVMADPLVIASYLGSDLTAIERSGTTTSMST